jgi:hypothetical protein
MQVPRPRQLRDASTVMRFRPAHQSMINRRFNDRASCPARQNPKQALAREPRIHSPASGKGGHESASTHSQDARNGRPDDSCGCIAVFAVFVRNYQPTISTFSAEILRRQRFGNRENSRILRCFPTVSVVRSRDTESAQTAATIDLVWVRAGETRMSSSYHKPQILSI